MSGMFSRLNQADKADSGQLKAPADVSSPPQSIEVPESRKPITRPNRKPAQVNQNVTSAQAADSKSATKQVSKQEINIACNIAILQADLEALRTPGYKAQTFRFTDEELDQLKDHAYKFSRRLKKKVGQGDLLRLGLLLFEKIAEEEPDTAAELLKAI